MKVGIIAPPKLLETYCLTEIQYCLPGLLFKNPTYRKFYTRKARDGNLVILDCIKPGWKRIPEDIELIKFSFKILGNPLIILPSHMYNSRKTLKAAKDFLSKLKPRNVAGCIEGADYKDIGKCVEELRKVSNCIAIPSHIYKIWRGEEWQGPVIYIDNHLNLGELDGVDGTLVTSLPIRLGLEGRLLSNYLPSPPSLTFKEEQDKYPSITKKNVEETIEYYQG